jgi:multidrug efflux pump
LGIAVFCGMLGVTAFGIFLTPVFFYVIEGLSETQLFASATMRWYGSLLAGAAGGLSLGFLLWKAGIGNRNLSLSVGAIVGVLTAFVVLRLKLRPQPQEHQK